VRVANLGHRRGGTEQNTERRPVRGEGETRRAASSAGRGDSSETRACGRGLVCHCLSDSLSRRRPPPHSPLRLHSGWNSSSSSPSNSTKMVSSSDSVNCGIKRVKVNCLSYS